MTQAPDIRAGGLREALQEIANRADNWQDSDAGDWMKSIHDIARAALAAPAPAGVTKEQIAKAIDSVFSTRGMWIDWKLRDLIADAILALGVAVSPRTWSTITEVCSREKCPRGGVPVEIVVPAASILSPQDDQAEPAAWQWRYVGKPDWQTPSGGQKLAIDILRREGPVEQRPLYANSPAPDRAAVIEECAKVADLRAFMARQDVRGAGGPKARRAALTAEETAQGIRDDIRALAVPRAEGQPK